MAQLFYVLWHDDDAACGYLDPLACWSRRLKLELGRMPTHLKPSLRPPAGAVTDKMDLTLSHSDPTNTEFSTTDGRVLYSTSTPFRMSGQTTKISKCLPNDGSPGPSGSLQEVAKIDWHYIGSTKIIYNGQASEVDKFLPRAGKFTE